jgi:pSer/pThr/pTyr-binding forkhead associated (FHA) protein
MQACEVKGVYMGKTKNAGGRKLVVLSGRTKGTAFVLTKPEVNAGRESDNAICLKGKRVSRYHAVLVRTNGEYTLRDVSPHIGTLLNGRRTKEATLKPGDRIRIGEIEMSYEVETVAAPVMESPSETMPALSDEVAAPVTPVLVAQEEPVAELVAENPTSEYQQRIAELTQETERLIVEAKRGHEALESVRAQLQTQSDLQAELSERLGVMSQENVVLAKRNSELQAKISQGKVSAEEAQHLEEELKQEAKRLVGEVKRANEALESLHAQLRMQSDFQADLTAQLGAMTQEKAALAKRNSELQTKVSELKVSAAKADHVETELATAQDALRKMSEELAKAHEATKLAANAKPADQTLPLKSAKRGVKLQPIPIVPAETHGEPGKIIEVSSPIQPMAVENDETRAIAAKKQEEAVTKRCASEQKTNEQFDKIRRTLVEKKNLKANMTLFERFMLPFRDTARLVVEESVSTDAE